MPVRWQRTTGLPALTSAPQPSGSRLEFSAPRCATGVEAPRRAKTAKLDPTGHRFGGRESISFFSHTKNGCNFRKVATERAMAGASRIHGRRTHERGGIVKAVNGRERATSDPGDWLNFASAAAAHYMALPGLTSAPNPWPPGQVHHFSSATTACLSGGTPRDPRRHDGVTVGATTGERRLVAYSRDSPCNVPGAIRGPVPWDL
jgi:hypothetical protein